MFFGCFDRSVEKSGDTTVVILKAGQIGDVPCRWFKFLGHCFTQSIGIVPNVSQIQEILRFLAVSLPPKNRASDTIAKI